MGFFKTFGRVIKGQPVFETPPPNAPQQQEGAATPGGPKVIPSAYIERVVCRLEGHDMECQAIIQNYSHEALQLDRLEIFGNTRYLNNAHLAPGEETEADIYEGPRPTSTLNSQCTLHYKTEAGDYFSAIHNIEFQKQPDNTYSINYIKFQSVRDI